MRHLTDDIVLSVKDAVRNLRYAVRSQAGAPSLATPGEAPANPAQARAGSRDARGRSRVARLVDKVFTEVESGALALVSPARDVGHGLIFPRPVADYFKPGRGSQDEAAERSFARTHYHAAKALLRGFELRNVLIFEHVIGRARDEVLRRHGDLVFRIRDPLATSATQEGRADLVLLSAALTCALVAARPIKEIDFSTQATTTPRGLAGAPNPYCFTVMGLATAIASIEDEASLPPAPEILESVNAVVDLRFGRFAEALEAANPAEALALEFGEVLPFLP
jgi:hypothetical protein